MEVKQIYNLINPWMGEVVGASAIDSSDWILKEDLSNISQIGDKLLSADSVTTAGEKWRDNFVHSMFDRIGRMVFVEREYRSVFPDLRRDQWDYGSIMTKSRTKRFAAKSNPAWSLVAGQTVDQFAFTPPEVITFFYNDKIAWQIDCSFADIQLREAFTSPREMDRFLSMIESAIARSFDSQIDLITSRTLNGLIAEKIYRNNAVVDLLADYNATVPAADQLTASEAITNVNWQRFAAYEILLYKNRLKAASNWFIITDEVGYDTQTPADRLRFALHADVAEALSVYLQSETYHNELSSIGSFDAVPFWQTSGGGAGFGFGATSRICCKLPSDNTLEVDRTHIIGVMWDWDAAAICNTDKRVTSAYNANGEYYNNFYKCTTQSCLDLMENAIVFVLGDGVVPTISISGDYSCGIGETETLTATTTGAGDSPTITWTSNNEAIATVIAGVVTGVSAGKCKIYASITVDGVTYTATKEFEVTSE